MNKFDHILEGLYDNPDYKSMKRDKYDTSECIRTKNQGPRKEEEEEKQKREGELCFNIGYVTGG